MSESTTLYWSEDGSIACEKHAPYRGSDTWRSGRWSRMTDDDQAMWRTANPKPAECETCGYMRQKAREASVAGWSEAEKRYAWGDR